MIFSKSGIASVANISASEPYNGRYHPNVRANGPPKANAQTANDTIAASTQKRFEQSFDSCASPGINQTYIGAITQHTKKTAHDR